MEKLLSNGIKYQTVPESYIFPPDKRPGNRLSACKAIPVIDLRGGKVDGDGRDEAVKQILRAGQEFGFFQVVNHGVSEHVINDMMGIAKEFFQLSIEDKALYYSDDPRKIARLHASNGNNNEEKLYWRDCLTLACYPVEEFIDQWPEKPSKLREILGRYSVEVRGAALRILKLICKALGLEEGYFDGDLIGGRVMMNINHYAACPDPSLTLGLPKHCDPGLITLLLQGDVSGLEIVKDGEWIAVEPLLNAFVVNFGHQLEIITNGLLRSVEHRAVTNSIAPRTSIATFIMPAMDSIIAPAQSIVHEHNLPFYRSFTFQEFMVAYIAKEGDRECTLEVFEIKA